MIQVKLVRMQVTRTDFDFVGCCIRTQLELNIHIWVKVSVVSGTDDDDDDDVPFVGKYTTAFDSA